MIISVGLVGMALPLTLYLQTVLGFSPLKAGLTMAPASLVSGVSRRSRDDWPTGAASTC